MAVLQEIKQITSTRRQLRSFSLVVGAVLILFGGYHYFFANASWVNIAAVGAGIMLAGVVIPRILKPLYWIWMVLAVVLGFIMSRVILTILFYLVLTPIGLIARLFGRRFMTLGPDSRESSYWIPKSPSDPKSIEKQF